ncbi:uncharacterized protein LOC144213961 [Stigmatopora nigra]
MKLASTVFIWAAVTVVTATDLCYSDRDKDHRLRLNCTAANLHVLPEDVQPTTEVLLFPGNRFSDLSWESFRILSQLHELDLTANEVSGVSAVTVPLLLHLGVLRLGRNRLTTLPGRAFLACPALTELHLNDNAIQSLDRDAFAGLGVLEVLDLSSNRIRVLPALLLRPLPVIETLYLENNQVSELADDWFNPREDVPYLFLSANPWACACQLVYLNTYLKDFYFNFYVRDGPIKSVDPKSLVCHSPPRFKGRAVHDIQEDDICGWTTLPPTGPAATTPGPTARVTEWEAGRGDGAVIRHPTPTTSPAPLPTTTWISTTLTPTLPPTTSPAPLPTTALDPTTLTPRLTTEPFGTWRPVGTRGEAVSLRRSPAVFCVWLLAGYACLCVAALGSILLTLVKLAIWYKVAYKPLSSALAGRRGGAAKGGRRPVYRSVLFVSREAEAMSYVTSLRRAPGTERALEQWSGAVDGPRGGEAGVGWRQRFSVLLRQEREGAGCRRATESLQLDARRELMAAGLVEGLTEEEAGKAPSRARRPGRRLRRHHVLTPTRKKRPVVPRHDAVRTPEGAVEALRPQWDRSPAAISSPWRGSPRISALAVARR